MTSRQGSPVGAHHLRALVAMARFGRPATLRFQPYSKGDGPVPEAGARSCSATQPATVRDMETPHDALAAFAKKRRLTQAALAAEVGTSRGMIGMIVCGLRRPGLDLAARIEAFAGIPAVSWARPPASGTEAA